MAEMDPQRKIDNVTESFKSLKAQIKEAKIELEKFEEGTEAYNKAAQRVANLSDKLDDVNDKVGLLKGDALERVAGGFKGIGGAILDLDVGKLQMANQSLKSIPFKELMGNVKSFGKELLTLATNPLFLIPAAIGLIISNFDKLMKIFPGLGKIVEGVKAVFDKLIQGVLDLIEWSGDLYEQFKPIINILFPITGLIEGLIDLLVEQGDTAEAQAKRRVEAEEKYKDSIEKSKKTIEKSKRETAVLLGKLSEEEAKKQELKEEFITNTLKVNEEARKKIKEAASKEEIEVIEKDRKLALEALNQQYFKDVLTVVDGEKKKAEAAQKVKDDAAQKASEKAKADEEKRIEEEKKKLQSFNNFLRTQEESRFNEEQKIRSDNLKKIKELETSFFALTAEEQQQNQKAFDDEKLRLNQEYITKIDELRKSEFEKEKERVTQEQNELLEAQKAANELAVQEQMRYSQMMIEAENNINLAKRSALNTGLQLLSDFAGKNKAIAIGILAIQKGLAIADVVTQASKSIAATIANTALANSAAVAASPLTGGFPFVAINTAAAAKNIAATKIAAAVNIATILAQGISGLKNTLNSGGGTLPTGGGGGSAGGSGPRPDSASLTGINDAFTIGGQPIGGASNFISNQGAQQGQMIKVFVSETDITSTQNKVKVIENDSLFK